MKQLVWLAAAAAVAQPVVIQRDARPMGNPADVVTFSPAGAAGIEFGFTAAMGPISVVKGSPYSADVVSESVQSLADGNRIVHKSASSFYRDSEGRTRRELTTEIPGQEPLKMVLIDDPVAGVHYSINLKEKTAHKVAMPRWAANPADRVFVAAPDMPSGQPEIRRFEFRNRSFGSVPDGAKTEQLGKQAIEGVEAVGTRTTIRIPAGQMGNEREMVSTSESWFSEELKTTVLSKRSDPRFGESSSRTTNIRRAEQPRYLFDPPADVKVIENGPMERVTDRVKTIEKL
jgi:hypothetical protein